MLMSRMERRTKLLVTLATVLVFCSTLARAQCSNTPYGAYTCVQSCQGQAVGTTTTCTFSSNVAAGHEVVAVGVTYGGPSSTLSFSGCAAVSSWNQPDLATGSINAVRHAYATSTSTAACSVTLTSSTSATIEIVGVELAGSNNINDGHVLTDTGYTTAPASSPIGTTSDGDLIIGTLGSESTKMSPVAGSGFTTLVTGTGPYTAIEGTVQATHGSIATNWTVGASYYVAGALAFQPGVATPGFTLSASPNSLSIAQSNQGNSTITAAISGGFNSAISLSASGVPAGTTVSFNPQTIPAPGSGSSIMTVAVGASTPVGTYPITVTGNGGGIQQNATVTLTVTTAGGAFPWSGILSPSRAIDWSNPGIPAGIPGRTTICSTLNPGATAAQITAAIHACPSGQVVFLNAGTYNVSSGIDFSNGHSGTGTSNVTLRGAGPDKTFLVFTGAVACENQGSSICLAGSSGSWTGNPTLNGGPVHNWTGGYAQGSTVLTMDSTAGWAVGQLLILDQFNDLTDTGGVFVGDITGTYIQEGIGPGRSCPNSQDPGCGATSGNKTQQEFKVITNISGNNVTISPAIYMPNWRSASGPQAWSPGVVGGTVGTMDGVEELSIDTTNDGSAAISNIEIANCYQCWVRNVRSINANRNHVWPYQAARIVVRDSYFFGTKNAASQSYGVETFMSADDLVENNIFQQVTTPIMMGNNSGSVYGYNYSVNSFFGSVLGYMSAGVSGNHDVTGMNLFEGNDTNQIINDNIHGTSSLMTAFRNRVRGWDTPAPLNATWAIDMMSYNRFGNFVGNVLGTAAVQSVYQENAPAGSANCSSGSSDVYLTGYKTGCVSGGSGNIVNDTLATTSLVRWGNYDVVHAANQFNCAEVDPAGALPYSSANACPSSQTLPSSFYRSSQPGFWTTPWGTPTWPPIGPDVTGGTAPDGAGAHAYAIPSQLCYSNTPIDSAYQKTYTVGGASWSGGSATLTIGSNTLVNGNTITVSGVNPSGYNGTFLVSGESGTTVTYPLKSNPGNYLSGGSVTIPNILLFNGDTCYSTQGQPAPPTNLTAMPQ